MPSRSSKHSNEQGAVLILVAMTIVAVVAFVALAIDTSRYSVSSEQQRVAAENIGLAAIERYHQFDSEEETAESRHEEKLEEALDRAEGVGGLLFTVALPGDSVVDDAANELDMDPHIAGHTNASGTLRPGRYWFFEPEAPRDCNHADLRDLDCPCQGAGTWGGPCFQPLTAGETNVGAFEVSLKTKDDSPLPAAFGQVFGQDSLSMESKAIASLIPQAFVVALDISGSTAYKTHLPYDSPEETAKDEHGNEIHRCSQGLNPTEYSYYAFKLRDDLGFTCNAGNHDNPCPTAPPYPPPLPDPGGERCRIERGGGDNAEYVYNYCLDDQRPRVGGVPVPGKATHHYKDDYKCYIVDHGDGTRGHYLVDAFYGPTDDGEQYTGPQPLNTVLAALHSALQIAEQRSVGDFIGFYPFDHDAYLPVRNFPLSMPGSSDFERLRRITDVNNAATFDERVNAMMFPRPSAGTDTAGVLYQIWKDLNEHDLTNVGSKRVAVISDGLATCSHRMTEERIDEHGNPYTEYIALFSLPDIFGSGRVDRVLDGDGLESCSVSYWNHHNWANHELEDIAEQFAKEEIALDMVMFPQESLRLRFTSTMIKDFANPDKCMSDLGAREHDLHYGDSEEGGFYKSAAYDCMFKDLGDPVTEDGGHFDSSFCGNPTFKHFRWPEYVARNKMAMKTGGYYVPLRDACDHTNAGVSLEECKDGAYEDHMDTICAAASPMQIYVAAPPFTVPSPYPFPAEDPLDECVNSSCPHDPRRDSTISCDTKCRSWQEQMEDYFREVFEKAPFGLLPVD